MGRALVLGGGGVTGVAWEIGLLTGLAEAGAGLAEAGVVVGTSAGSVVGALVAGGLDHQELYAGQLAPPTAEIPARLSLAMMLRHTVAGQRRPRRRPRPGGDPRAGDRELRPDDPHRPADRRPRRPGRPDPA